MARATTTLLLLCALGLAASAWRMHTDSAMNVGLNNFIAKHNINPEHITVPPDQWCGKRRTTDFFILPSS